MAIGTLLDGKVADYLAADRDRPGDLWFFIHIPKTAGSSLRHEVGARLRPEANLFAAADPVRPHNELLMEALQAFLERPSTPPCRFASGHLMRRHLVPLLERRPDTRLLTLLREPVARVISDFRYQRTPAHPGSMAFMQRFPTLMDFASARPARNKMYRFLRVDAASAVEQVIEDVERGFAFVGLTERYVLACRTLLALLGFAADPSVHKRRTEDLPENAVDDLERLRPELEALNVEDVALYRHFAQRWQACVPALERHLAELSACASPT
jgi:hypothetical protein